MTYLLRLSLALKDLMNSKLAIPKLRKWRYSSSYSLPPMDINLLDNIVDAGNDNLYNGTLDYV